MKKIFSIAIAAAVASIFAASVCTAAEPPAPAKRQACHFTASVELQAVMDGGRQVNLGYRAADIDEDITAESTIANMLTWGIVAEEGTSAARITGARAENRIRSRTPVFLELGTLEGQSPDDTFALVRLTVVENKDRIVIMGEVSDSLFGGYKLRWKFKEGIQIPLKLEKVQNSCTYQDMVMNVYRGVPAVPLAPGEYVLLYGERFYDFGVDY